jgi:molybdenum cofactor cytidylyltransferase
MDKTPIAAIVLAAGQSRRMGAKNKLHLPVNGEALLRRTVKTLQASELGEIVVVLGHQSQLAHALLEGLAVRSVYNERYLSGQMSSVHCGLAALKKSNAGVMIALADQPAITTEEINLLIDSFRGRSTGEVVIPTFRGARGNPIVISEQSRSDILCGKRDLGCRKFIEKNPGLVKMVEMPSSGVIIDLDTPADYNNYCSPDEIEEPVNTMQQVN